MTAGPAFAPAASWMLRAGVVVLCSGCFFTDPVNGAPTARIEQIAPGEVRKLTMITLSARQSTDPDGDGLTWAWRAATMCGAPSCTPFATGAAREFAFEIPSHDPVVVTLEVTDRPGARSTDSLTLVPVNRVPTLDVQARGRKNARGGFLLDHPVEILAEGHDDLDRDPLTYSASCFPPPGVSTTAACTQVGESGFTLTPDALGIWEVEVQVTDGIDVAKVRIPIAVDEDLPPCIVATSPAAIAGARYVLGHGDPPRRFGVDLVSDELDPYPLPAADDPLLAPTRFRWSVRPPSGDHQEVPGLSLAELSIDPSAWSPGSIVELRVEAMDRIARVLPCADDAPVCPVDDPCVQRVTWEVEIR